mgnify:CR=1
MYLIYKLVIKIKYLHHENIPILATYFAISSFNDPLLSSILSTLTRSSPYILTVYR